MTYAFFRFQLALCRGLLLPLSLVSACSAEPPSQAREAVDEINDVSRLGVAVNFTTLIRELPTSGDSKKIIWNSNWFPLSQGGTTEVMRKYDQATGSHSAEAWEAATVASQGHVEWAGHCNGLAAASINEDPPQRPVWFQGQYFSIEDIKALMIEKWQGTRLVTMVGARCYTQATTDDFGRITTPGCRDMNAGSFHVLLGNMLGKNFRGFIIDHTAGDEVWNSAVDGYRSTIEVIAPDTARALTNIASASSYLWNPDALEFMKVQTNVRFASGHIMKLNYLLELKHGSIIGGEWILNSRLNHPDFAWTATKPDPANPHLDMAVLDEIIRQSRQ